MRKIRHIRPVKALLVGDSYTDYGSGDEYPNYLSSHIAVANLGNAGTPFAAATFGTALEARLPSELAANTDCDVVVVASAGINDIGSGLNQTSAVIIAAYEAIYDLIVADNRAPIFCGIPVLPNWSADRKAKPPAIEAAMREFCGARGVPWISLIDEFCDANGIKADYQIPAESPSFTHLNAAGCRLLASKVENAIRCTVFRKAAVA